MRKQRSGALDHELLGLSGDSDASVATSAREARRQVGVPDAGMAAADGVGWR
jgi:hypothetical protein